MLLTIGIPTYNRASILRGTLINLAKQIEKSGLRDVEIVISDNCSTDETVSVCAEIAAQFPSVPTRYFCNDTNIGFDRNVDALFHRSNAEYIWTFSDDDVANDAAVVNIRRLLAEKFVKFAFVNYDINVDGKIIESRYGSGPTRWVDSRDLLKTVRFSISLVTSCVFNREAWLASHTEKYFGTLFIHLFTSRDVLSHGAALIVGQKLIRMIKPSLENSRKEKRGEKTDQIEFYMRAHLKFLQYADELSSFGFDKETCFKAKCLGESEDLRQVLNYKLAAADYDHKELIKIWCELRQYRALTARFWCLTTPLLFAPNGFLKFLRKVSRSVRRG